MSCSNARHVYSFAMAFLILIIIIVVHIPISREFTSFILYYFNILQYNFNLRFKLSGCLNATEYFTHTVNYNEFMNRNYS